MLDFGCLFTAARPQENLTPLPLAHIRGRANAIAPAHNTTTLSLLRAVGAGTFKTLAAALGAAGLVDTLKSAGPFTVFAPTDDAFAKLPKGTVESLLLPENKAQLIGILTHHVVAGKVTAADVMKLTTANTVASKPIKIAVKEGKVMIEVATVTTADIHCTNGVVHVVDSVILAS